MGNSTAVSDVGEGNNMSGRSENQDAAPNHGGERGELGLTASDSGGDKTDLGYLLQTAEMMANANNESTKHTSPLDGVIENPDGKVPHSVEKQAGQSPDNEPRKDDIATELGNSKMPAENPLPHATQAPLAPALNPDAVAETVVDNWKVLSDGRLQGTTSCGKKIVSEMRLLDVPFNGALVRDANDTFYRLGSCLSDKKRQYKKRQVGAAAESINQMKDPLVMDQNGKLVYRLSIVQQMMSYKDPSGQKTAPTCTTVMINRDEIAHNPKSRKDGMKHRDVTYSVMVPPGMTKASLAEDLDELSGHLKRRHVPTNLCFTDSGAAYLDSIFGDGQGQKTLKKAKAAPAVAGPVAPAAEVPVAQRTRHAQGVSTRMSLRRDSV